MNIQLEVQPAQTPEAKAGAAEVMDALHKAFRPTFGRRMERKKRAASARIKRLADHAERVTQAQMMAALTGRQDP